MESENAPLSPCLIFRLMFTKSSTFEVIYADWSGLAWRKMYFGFALDYTGFPALKIAEPNSCAAKR